MSKKLLFLLLPLIFSLACGLGGSGDGGSSSVVSDSGTECAANAIEISIIYAPESELYMNGENYDAINRFNRAYAEGRNPLTGEALKEGEQPICVTGQSGSSGTVAQGIINAIIAPNNANVAKPTIFEPSVSHWLALVNQQSGRQVFDLADSPSTALAPVVMAIWESRLQAIQKKNGGQPVGWEELMAVMDSPNGWADYGIPGSRTTVYYGHTDPYISSTALSTLIAEFYASARYNAGQTDLRKLDMPTVRDQAVQQGVRKIETLVKHYSSRTTEFKEYIAQGPNYLDFVALEENDLIYINQGKTQYKPPEKLVALYPKEGTFWHEHPFGIPNADWVSDEQRAAAKVFTEYVRSETVQRKVLENGFRPVNPDVPIGYPITPELGVDPNQPTNILTVPDPDVIAAVQASWQYVKKQGDILLVVDTSGSMDGDKINQARQAGIAFMDKMPTQNRVGLMLFSDEPHMVTQLGLIEDVKGQITQQMNSMQADGSTALYDALSEAIDSLQAVETPEGEDRIRAIVVLSDGQDTASNARLNDVLEKISSARSGRDPILVIPVAYGDDADISALNNIAQASATKVQSGDPNDIQKLLEIISSYF